MHFHRGRLKGGVERAGTGRPLQHNNVERVCAINMSLMNKKEFWRAPLMDDSDRNHPDNKKKKKIQVVAGPGWLAGRGPGLCCLPSHISRDPERDCGKTPDSHASIQQQQQLTE